MPKIIERTVTLPAPPPYKIYITQPASPATSKPPKKEPPYCPTFEQGENFSAKFVPDDSDFEFLRYCIKHKKNYPNFNEFQMRKRQYFWTKQEIA